MYDVLSSFYDKLADDFDYDLWAARYLTLTEGAESALECGCGTGSVSVRLAKRIPRLIASDISEGMLRIASEKARKHGVSPRFVLQDMRQIALPRPADAIVAPCDCVNYLLTDGDVRRFFQSAFQNIRAGGTLAFDFSTGQKLLDMCEKELFFEDRDDITFLWRNALQGDARVLMELTFFVRQPGGAYLRFDERQVQRIHELERLISLLEEAGFSDIAAYDALSENPPHTDSQRILLRAKKHRRT